MPPLSDTYISSSEAAKILGIHAFTIQKLLQATKLPAEKIANRWLIRRADAEEFAKTYQRRRDRPRQKRKYTKRSPKWNA